MLPERNLAAGRTAIARAHRALRQNPDDPNARDQLTTAQQNYAAAKISQHIEDVVASAPPLTGEQLASLARLLLGRSGDAA